MDDIGQRIKSIRKNSQKTQKELGELLNLKPSTITLMEQGKSKLTVESLILLCKEYQISADWLLFGTESEKDFLTDEERKLIKGYRACTDKEKGRIEEIIDSSEGNKMPYDKVGNL